MDEMDKQFIQMFLIVCAGVAVLVAIALIVFFVIPDAVLDYLYCNTQQGLMPDIDFQWNLVTGCLIEAPDGTWVDARDYLSVGRLRLNLEEE